MCGNLSKSNVTISATNDFYICPGLCGIKDANLGNIERGYNEVFEKMMDTAVWENCTKCNIFQCVLEGAEHKRIWNREVVSLAKRISDVVILIEPLARKDSQGIQFEQILMNKFSKHNITKCYYNALYWKNIANYNAETDDEIILVRDNFEKFIVENHMLAFNGIEKNILSVQIQDIIILKYAGRKE